MKVPTGLFTVLLLAGLAGCELWQQELAPPSELPPLKPSLNNAMLDVTFLRVPLGSPGLDSLWQHLDEQHIDAQLRQHLLDNGIRCGLIGRQLPESLEELVTTSSEEQTAQTGLTHGVTIHRLGCPPGSSRQLAATSPMDELIVLRNDGKTTRGDVYQQAQCLVNLKCDPISGDRVELELVPEIHHGEPRRQVVAGQGTYQYVVRKDKDVLDDLKVRTSLAPGQTLIMSSSPEPKGVGRSFFTENAGGERQHKILLIRLVHAPPESLFESTREDELPLADDWP